MTKDEVPPLDGVVEHAEAECDVPSSATEAGRVGSDVAGPATGAGSTSEPAPPSPLASFVTWRYVIAAVVAVAFAVRVPLPGGDPRATASTRTQGMLANASAYAAGDRPELALMELGKAVGADPGSADAHAALGRFLAVRGHLDAADVELHAALAAREDVSTLVELGLLDLRRGKLEDAIARFRRAIELDKTSPAANIDLCIALLNAERPNEALASCARATALDPANVNALHNLGYAYRLSGQQDKAIATLSEVLAREPGRVISLFELAEAYIAAGDDAQARVTLRRLLAIAPNHLKAQSRLQSIGG